MKLVDFTLGFGKVTLLSPEEAKLIQEKENALQKIKDTYGDCDMEQFKELNLNQLENIVKYAQRGVSINDAIKLSHEYTDFVADYKSGDNEKNNL
ncbi:MAG: hypothetical protein A4E53_01324 [Pelotomaculum sp. PtaB.Bin104]|nr:MAG: hypothetical protein A4E53_01324 [Pelotomaculum sp. PtaB.Bin104]